MTDEIDGLNGHANGRDWLPAYSSAKAAENEALLRRLEEDQRRKEEANGDAHPNAPGADKKAPEMPGHAHPNAPGADEPERQVVRFKRLKDMPPIQEVPQLIKGLLTMGQPAVLFGRSLAAKSFLIADMGRAITTGANWFGRKVEEGCVLYVPFEGENTFPGRMHAIASELDADEIDLFTDRFSMLPEPLPLSPDTAQKAADEIIANVKALEAITGIACGLVALDTMFASLPGVSLVEDSVVTHVMHIAKRVSSETGAVTLFAHHPGHGQQQRMFGSSAAIGGFNSIIRVDAPEANYEESIGISPEEERVVYLEKWKDGRSDIQVGKFNLKILELGTDSDGEPITSCVVNITEVGGEAAPKKKREAKMAVPVTKAYEQLQRLYEPNTELQVLGTDIGIPTAAPGEMWRVVRKADWKAACFKARLSLASTLNKDNQRRLAKLEDDAFRRAVEALEGKHRKIATHGDYVWILEINKEKHRATTKREHVSAVSAMSADLKIADAADRGETASPICPPCPQTSIGSADTRTRHGRDHRHASEGSNEPDKTEEPKEPSPPGQRNAEPASRETAEAEPSGEAPTANQGEGETRDRGTRKAQPGSKRRKVSRSAERGVRRNRGQANDPEPPPERP